MQVSFLLLPEYGRAFFLIRKISGGEKERCATRGKSRSGEEKSYPAAKYFYTARKLFYTARKNFYTARKKTRRKDRAGTGATGIEISGTAGNRSETEM